MKQNVTNLFIAFVLLLRSSSILMAQNVSADSFLDSVSAHPVADQEEQMRFGAAYQELSSASSAEVKRELPSVLQYTRRGSDIHVRKYAILFLSCIAIRQDGASLLSASSGEIAALVTDPDPGIQKGAVAIIDYVIAKDITNKQAYATVLKSAISNTRTPQDEARDMVEPLLFLRIKDPTAVKSILGFINRADLTADTRRELVKSLGTHRNLPEQVSQYLVKELGDPDLTVRAAAVVAFADSTTEFHMLGKDQVLRMANDPQEDARIRELAKDAIAGKTHLDPNIDSAPKDR